MYCTLYFEDIFGFYDNVPVQIVHFKCTCTCPLYMYRQMLK